MASDHVSRDEPACGFCAETHQRQENNAFVPLVGPDLATRCILAQTPAAVVMPSVGALVPGHVLVVPVAHWHSFGLLPPDELQSACSLVLESFEVLSREYDTDVVAFEHGSLDGVTTSGACSDHAHLHLLPLDRGLRAHVSDAGSIWRRIEQGESVLSTAMRILRDGESYLSLWDGSTWWIRRGGAKPQEIRRIVGGALGRPDEWDWGVFPNVQNILATVASLRGKFGAPKARPEDMVLNFSKGNIATLPKFVRRGVPAAMSQLSLRVEEPNPSELTYWLSAKLVEEAEEAGEALFSGDVTAIRHELADVLEVLHSIAARAGIEWESLESVRRNKRELLGGFDDGVVSRFPSA